MLKLLLIFYVLICVGLYFFQEKLLFFPDRLNKNHKYAFGKPFEELFIKTKGQKFTERIAFQN
jgi:hypothetical protein